MTEARERAIEAKRKTKRETKRERKQPEPAGVAQFESVGCEPLYILAHFIVDDIRRGTAPVASGAGERTRGAQQRLVKAWWVRNNKLKLTALVDQVKDAGLINEEEARDLESTVRANGNWLPITEPQPQPERGDVVYIVRCLLRSEEQDAPSSTSVDWVTARDLGAGPPRAWPPVAGFRQIDETLPAEERNRLALHQWAQDAVDAYWHDAAAVAGRARDAAGIRRAPGAAAGRYCVIEGLPDGPVDTKQCPGINNPDEPEDWLLYTNLRTVDPKRLVRVTCADGSSSRCYYRDSLHKWINEERDQRAHVWPVEPINRWRLLHPSSVRDFEAHARDYDPLWERERLQRLADYAAYRKQPRVFVGADEDDEEAQERRLPAARRFWTEDPARLRMEARQQHRAAERREWQERFLRGFESRRERELREGEALEPPAQAPEELPRLSSRLPTARSEDPYQTLLREARVRNLTERMVAARGTQQFYY
jgi:hypothetical protein